MLFTDGKVVMSFADEQSAEQNGFTDKFHVHEMVYDFIDWFSRRFDNPKDGSKIEMLASDYDECIRYYMRCFGDTRLTFARTAVEELWTIIAGKMEQDSRFKKVTTFVYA